MEKNGLLGRVRFPSSALNNPETPQCMASPFFCPVNSPADQNYIVPAVAVLPSSSFLQFFRDP